MTALLVLWMCCACYDSRPAVRIQEGGTSGDESGRNALLVRATGVALTPRTTLEPTVRAAAASMATRGAADLVKLADGVDWLVLQGEQILRSTRCRRELCTRLLFLSTIGSPLTAHPSFGGPRPSRNFRYQSGHTCSLVAAGWLAQGAAQHRHRGERNDHRGRG